MIEPAGRGTGAPDPRVARDPAADRAYCRSMLPRVSRTFAINIRLLGGSFQEAVRVAYLLCRSADALEDSWPGPPEAVAGRFDRLAEALAGDGDAADALSRAALPRVEGRADLELIVGLPRVLGAYSALAAADRADIGAGVAVMCAGMKRYATRFAERAGAGERAVPYLDTEDELRDYCWVVAGCVGVMLTRLFTRRASPSSPPIEARRLELAPVVGEALQLTNILLDWPADVRRGRCHVPARWLAEFDLDPLDLRDAARPGVRILADRLEGLARAALGRVPEYVDTLPARHVRYRLFCLWPALWALASLAHARRDSEFPGGARRPRLPRSKLRGIALRSLLVAHHPRFVRWLVAQAG